MIRLTDNDYHLGPLTGAWSDWKNFSLVYSSGDAKNNWITLHLWKLVIRLTLPKWMDGVYFDREYQWYPRDYGISYYDKFLQIFKGVRTNDSSTDKSWCCFIPWLEYRMVRYSLYDEKGEVYKHSFDKGGHYHLRQDCPKVFFEFDDYDGKRIVATTLIEERQWKRGCGKFKWVSWFCKDKVIRSLDIAFSDEVGPEKGSRKGGTLGHGIDMLPGESHQQAFRRYCDKQHSSKSGPFNIKYVGELVNYAK